MNESNELTQTSRREFIKRSALAAAGLTLAGIPVVGAENRDVPNSKINGIQIGVIVPYSFRSMPSSAEDLLKYCLNLGINAVEMQNTPVELFAGAPAAPAGLFGPLPGANRGAGAPSASAPAPGGRRQLTPEQQAAVAAHAKEMSAWRTSVSMDKFKALRKMYADAGVSLYAFKLGLTMAMADAEYDYAFTAAKALGADHLTMELPEDAELTKRVGEFATKHEMMVGYHAHTQATPELWDVAISQSKFNGINLDIGHYVAGTSQSPIPLIIKYHDKITSMHVKDRKNNNGPNMPWGQGDTPIKEVLQLMKEKKYTFPATIELEYPVPEGSTAEQEVAKCLTYMKAALA